MSLIGLDQVTRERAKLCTQLSQQRPEYVGKALRLGVTEIAVCYAMKSSRVGQCQVFDNLRTIAKRQQVNMAGDDSNRHH